MVGSVIGPAVGAGIGLLGGGGGGGGGYQSTQPILPGYLTSALEQNIGRAGEVFTRPFEAYAGSDAVAPLSADEQTAFEQLRNVLFGRTIPMFDQAQDLITRAGERAEFGPQAGQLSAYMNPFQQGVTDIAKLEAIRNWENEFQNIHGAANKVNAFGGSGQRILESESYRNIAERLDDLQMRGDYANFANALNQFNTGTGMMSNTALGQGSLAATGQGIQMGDVGALSNAGATQRGIDQAMLDVDFSEFLRGQGWDQQQIQQYSNVLAQAGNVIGGQSAVVNQPEGNKWAGALGGAMIGSQVGNAFNSWNTNRKLGNASADLDNIFASNPDLFGFAEGGLVRKPEKYPHPEAREFLDNLRMAEMSAKLQDSSQLTDEDVAQFEDILQAIYETNAGKDLRKKEGVEKYADGGLINFDNVTSPFKNIFSAMSDPAKSAIGDFFSLPAKEEIRESMENPFGLQGIKEYLGELSSPVFETIGKAPNKIGEFADWATSWNIHPDSTLGQLVEGYKFEQEEKERNKPKKPSETGVAPASPEASDEAARQAAVTGLPVGPGTGYTMDDLPFGAPKGSSAGVSMLPVVKGAEAITRAQGGTEQSAPTKSFMDNVNKPILAMGIALMKSRGNFNQALGEGGAAYMAAIEKEEAKALAQKKAQLEQLDKMSQIQKRQMEMATIPYDIQRTKAQIAESISSATKNAGASSDAQKDINTAFRNAYNEIYKTLGMRPDVNPKDIPEQALQGAWNTAKIVGKMNGVTLPEILPTTSIPTPMTMRQVK